MALRKQNRTKSNKKTLLFSLLIAVLLVIAYGLYAYAFDQWPFADNSRDNTEQSNRSNQSDDDDEEFIDDQPATDEDQEEANQKKETAYEKQKKDNEGSQSDKSSNYQKKVNVTLTTFYQESGSLHANGFVAGVLENDGTCKLTLTNQAGKSVSVSRKGHRNATNTTCGQSSIELSKLSPGKWTPELSYSSNTSKGTTGPNAWDPIEVK